MAVTAGRAAAFRRCGDGDFEAFMTWRGTGGRDCGVLLRHLARADARSAGQDGLASAVHDGVDAPQVRLPAPLGDVMGVTDPIAEHRTLAADFT